MNILIAIDSFKGSLTSDEAGYAAAEGIRRACPDAVTIVRPLADGGEGTVETLAAVLGGELRRIRVSDPLGRPIESRYALCPSGTSSNIITAVIEMSAAAGLPLLKPDERDPLITTTYGVGELIADAVSQGARDFIIGIGGSATNDGGAGMLTALGFELTDSGGSTIAPGARGLSQLRKIGCEHILPGLRECRFRVACDVKNPLCGESGCSAVFAPQKGAAPDTIAPMDGWLADFAALAKLSFPDADPELPGSGAAGGLGFALRTFLSATLESGAGLILDASGFEELVMGADIVVTGEGRLDAQTIMGKAPAAVAALAKKYEKPCIALSGCVSEEAGICNQYGIDAFFPALRQICTADEAMEPSAARANLADAAEQVFRLISLFKQ